jgi:hypothetical protein
MKKGARAALGRHGSLNALEKWQREPEGRPYEYSKWEKQL